MKLRKTIQVALILVGIAYPFLILFGLRHLPAYVLGILLILLVITRHMWGGGRRKSLIENVIFGLGLAVICGLMLVDDGLALLIYPLIMNLGFAVIFTHSLLYPPSIIEKFARLHEPDLNEKGVVYTRRVTQVWIGFFVVNGMVSAFTALSGDLRLWTLYNGFIAYVLMGALFVGEVIIRQFVKASHKGA